MPCGTPPTPCHPPLTHIRRSSNPTCWRPVLQYVARHCPPPPVPCDSGPEGSSPQIAAHRDRMHAHESPAVMWVPLAVLAALSLAGGWLFPIPAFLKAMFPAVEEAENPMLMYISVFAGLA